MFQLRYSIIYVYAKNFTHVEYKFQFLICRTRKKWESFLGLIFEGNSHEILEKKPTNRKIIFSVSCQSPDNLRWVSDRLETLYVQLLFHLKID